MVRAGVVKHPSEWPFCGYNEIQVPKGRYALFDDNGLKDLLNFKEMDKFAESYRGWIEESLKKVSHCRDGKWTESIAVGCESFVTETKELLGFNVKGRVVTERDGIFELRESVNPYNSFFGHKNAILRSQNGYPWKVFDSISV
jgi:putative transposase